jgi:hypothetical protein
MRGALECTICVSMTAVYVCAAIPSGNLNLSYLIALESL